MSITSSKKGHSPVRKQAEAYKESWLEDHEIVRECWIWEDQIALGLNCGAFIRTLERVWRERVFRGIQPACESDIEDFKRALSLWLEVTDGIVDVIESKFEPEYKVDGADDLRLMYKELSGILENWVDPKISSLVAYREFELSDEGADEFEQFLENAKKTPTPRPAGSVPKTITHAEFLAMPTK